MNNKVPVAATESFIKSSRKKHSHQYLTHTDSKRWCWAYGWCIETVPAMFLSINELIIVMSILPMFTQVYMSSNSSTVSSASNMFVIVIGASDYGFGRLQCNIRNIWLHSKDDREKFKICFDRWWMQFTNYDQADLPWTSTRCVSSLTHKSTSSFDDLIISTVSPQVILAIGCSNTRVFHPSRWLVEIT